jgi:rod shape-determining protein MreD
MGTLTKLAIVLALGIFSVVLQGTLFKVLFGFNFFVPHLLLIISVLIAFLQPNSFGAVCCFLLGLLADFSSVVLIGPWAAAFVVVFFVVSIFSQKLFYDSGFTAFVVVFVMTLLASSIYLGLELQFKKIDTSIFDLSSSLLLEAFISACFAPLIFPVIGAFLSRRFGPIAK